MDENKTTMPTEEKLTINVKNEKVEELIHEYAKDKSTDNLNKLIIELHKCRLLIPGAMSEGNKPLPSFLRNADGDVYLPVYTQKEQIPAEPKVEMILNVDYESINKLCIKPDLGILGIVFNPFSDNLIFKKELLLRIHEVDEKNKKALEERKAQLEELKKNAPKPQQVKLTEPQYNMLMRKQYEFGFLPVKFFKEGQAFMDMLCEKKEEYIDELFEEAYQEKRLYPFLPEDFSVMVMNIREDLLIVRLDMPERDMFIPSCYRIYFTWNAVEGKGRYFTIEKTKAKDVKLLGEMNKEIQHVTIGNAPVEGAELQEIINIQKGVSSLTS